VTRHAKTSVRHARRTGDASRVSIGHFLHVNRTVLGIAAATLAFSVLGIHDLPAQAVELPKRHGGTVAGTQSDGADSDGADTAVRTAVRVAAAARTDSTARDQYGMTRYDLVMWPIDPTSPISNPFGKHDGTDFTPGLGTPIVSASEGVVVEAGNPSGALGVHLKIRSTVDGDTVTFVYGHMLQGSMNLTEGSVVHRGQLLGRVGSTGTSTGPHLHFGILRGGTAIDPIAWMRAHVNS
jgi:murein DD-endopeptidase MepM/ murein hydrolase activator NlpD